MSEPYKQMNLYTRRTSAPKKIITPENEIQAAFFVWLRLNENRFPALRFCFAVPNGGHRFKSTAAMMKRTGTRAGVPDVFLPVPSQSYCGLWIEFKSEVGKPSDAQTAFIAFLQSQNYQVSICRTWGEAANVVIEYLDLPVAKIAER